MEYEHPFVQEVRTNPHDVAPRLIYADYLEESGDPRAELIRVQVELSQLPPGDPARRESELRETALLDEYADEWLAPLKELGAQGLSRRSLQRGLIERVKVNVNSLIEHGEAICREAPALHGIELRASDDDLLALAEASLPPQITALDLGSNRLTAMGITRLVSAPWCRQLQQLSLAFNRLGDDAMRRLGQGNWAKLVRLNLNVNAIGPQGITAFTLQPAMPKLEVLHLNSNPLMQAGLDQLASSYLATTLRELDVGASGVTAIERLAASPLGERLESLILRGNALKEMDTVLASLERMPSLKHVDLRGTHSQTARYGYGTTNTAAPAKLRERLGDGLVW